MADGDQAVRRRKEPEEKQDGQRATGDERAKLRGRRTVRRRQCRRGTGIRTVQE